ncbi:putative nuclease HARBI1 [Halichoeres trimaculatus]|uniref:putative nuclease HARBI1 n=1 Tax=Halichoeres trimaculatus TaxID=147232 RepID=UPI003D9F7563
MDFSEFIVSAGRAVLDIVESEWQPLSSAELEQRLDHAVEDILEADLMAKLKSQPPPPTIYVQLQQSQADVQAQVLQTTTTCSPQEEEGTQDPGEFAQTLDSAAVQHIADLLQTSKSRARMAGRACLSLSHTIMLSLTLLSERISYRTVSQRFHLEKGNIHRIFFSFCERVNVLEETLITWPSGQEAVESLVPLCSPEKEQGDHDIPLVLGVLGHTCIPIRLPIGKRDVESTAPEVKRMKTEAHADSWLNLELVCDHNGRFLHCSISKESDVDRGRALRDKLKQNPELLPSGSFLVARSGYPLSAQILTPHSGSLGPREELFNKTLEGHFHILDQAVANLKTRFQRLRYLDIGNYDRARAVVLTACVLHNVFLDMGQVVQGEVETEESLSSEAEEELDEEGVQRRDVVSDLLFKNVDSVGA